MINTIVGEYLLHLITSNGAFWAVAYGLFTLSVLTLTIVRRGVPSARFCALMVTLGWMVSNLTYEFGDNQTMVGGNLIMDCVLCSVIGIIAFSKRRLWILALWSSYPVALVFHSKEYSYVAEQPHLWYAITMNLIFVFQLVMITAGAFDKRTDASELQVEEH